MKRITLATLALVLVPAALHADQMRGFELESTPSREPLAAAPEAWSHQDPADSLYRAAREAMNRGDHDRAATLFRRVWERHARSAYAPDAPYWEAFNLYRTDETENLQRALEVLEIQRERYAGAPTRQNGDATSLAARIRGLLARRGDEESAQEVVVAVNEIVEMGKVIGEEVAAHMEVVAQAMAEQGQVLAEEIAILAQQGAAIGRRFSGGGQDIPEQCREQAETQLAALNALIQMNAERAMPVLGQVMQRRDECSTPLRRRAVFLIADKEGTEAVDILLDAARNDPDLEVRRQAVFWLSEVDDERAVEALDQFVRTSDDHQIRERAIFALSQHDSPAARRILRRVAQDGNTPAELQGKAIFWLAQEGDTEDLTFLKGMLGRGNVAMDKRIVTAVGQAGREDDAAWLLGVAENADIDTEVRQAAVFWAADTGASVEDLGRLYDRVQDRSMKERILFGLSESEQPGAVDRLIGIARTERDTELRKKAIFWLGNSNDPRAADVLMELISNPPGGGR